MAGLNLDNMKSSQLLTSEELPAFPSVASNQEHSIERSPCHLLKHTFLLNVYRITNTVNLV